MMRRLAIVSGAGDLPRLLAEYCAVSGQQYCVVTLKGFPLNWISDHPTIPARIEQISKLCVDLQSMNCDRLVFAGAISRPPVDKSTLDPLGARLAEAVLGALKKGDDQTLRFVIALFEEQGFNVVGASEILPELVPNVGNLGERGPTSVEMADANLGKKLIAALGEMDVGQGAVVASGLCLGLETIQGTDQMLDFAGSTRPHSGGVLVKAPKPGQDIRIDMPVIGIETVENAIKAGLGGIAIKAGGVMILNRADVIATADAANLAIWAFE